MRAVKWTWLGVAGLLTLCLVGCSQALPIQSMTAGAVTQAVQSLPSELPSPSVDIINTPSPTQDIPLGTAVPISATRRAAQEETVLASPDMTLQKGESTETVKLAKQDLADRLGIPVNNIAVVAVIRQRFPADSFQCRVTKARIAKDESPHVLSGESILLSAEGRKYEYRASGQTVIFCQELR
jgi:uncharacterized cupin superfamily protein